MTSPRDAPTDVALCPGGRRLRDGYRMEAPKFSPNSAYQLMLDCWREMPSSRPSFTELSERLGECLEEHVKKVRMMALRWVGNKCKIPALGGPLCLKKRQLISGHKDDSHCVGLSLPSRYLL